MSKRSEGGNIMEQKQPLVKVEVDQDADAAYIRLSECPVHRTVEVNDMVFVDLDEFNVAIGIEVLGLGTRLPLDEIVRNYHVRSEVCDVIYLLLPNIAWRFNTAPDSTSVISNRVASSC